MTDSLAPAANIAKLLKESMAVHDRCGMIRRSKGDWLPVMQQAYDLRVAAHDADPDHLDPAWAIEEGKTNTSGPTHEQLMAFYRKHLLLT